MDMGFHVLGFEDRTASAAPSPLYCYGVKAVTGTTQQGSMTLSIKHDLLNQVTGESQPTGCSLLGPNPYSSACLPDLFFSSLLVTSNFPASAGITSLSCLLESLLNYYNYFVSCAWAG